VVLLIPIALKAERIPLAEWDPSKWTVAVPSFERVVWLLIAFNLIIYESMGILL
jgi:hypothetical protein